MNPQEKAGAVVETTRTRDVLSPESLGRAEALALSIAVGLAAAVAAGWFDPMMPWSG
jgi:hypothetical protein